MSSKDILRRAGITDLQEPSRDNIAALVDQVMVAQQRIKRLQSTNDKLSTKYHRLRLQTIHDFLYEKNVSPVLIEMVETDARNRGKAPQGWRFTENDITRSVSLVRGAGPKSLRILQSWFIMAGVGTASKPLRKNIIRCGFDVLYAVCCPQRNGTTYE